MHLSESSAAGRQRFIWIGIAAFVVALWLSLVYAGAAFAGGGHSSAGWQNHTEGTSTSWGDNSDEGHPPPETPGGEGPCEEEGHTPPGETPPTETPPVETRQRRPRRWRPRRSTVRRRSRSRRRRRRRSKRRRSKRRRSKHRRCRRRRCRHRRCRHRRSKHRRCRRRRSRPRQWKRHTRRRVPTRRNRRPRPFSGKVAVAWSCLRSRVVAGGSRARRRSTKRLQLRERCRSPVAPFRCWRCSELPSWVSEPAYVR